MKEVTEKGAPAEYDGPRERIEGKAHKSFMEHLEEGLTKLWKDAKHGRSLFMSERTDLEGVLSLSLIHI